MFTLKLFLYTTGFHFIHSKKILKYYVNKSEYNNRLNKSMINLNLIIINDSFKDRSSRDGDGYYLIRITYAILNSDLMNICNNYMYSLQEILQYASNVSALID